MSTDDRDIESSNPSKNFKVGEFDQRSGFFTPVWESKRRIRSEPPPPSSRKAADSTSPSRPASRPPASAGTPPTRAAVGASDRESTAVSSPATGVNSPAKAGAAVPRPRAPSEGKPRSSGGRASSKKAAPAKASESAAPASQHEQAVILPPAVAAVFNAAPEPTAAAPGADTSALAQPSLDAGSRAAGQSQGVGKTPSAAARALQSAGPDLPPAAFLDEEPDFRPPLVPSAPRPPRVERPALQQRALRASAAATRIHEQLKAKLQAEAAEIAESRYELEPETNRTPMSDLELRGESEPFPLSSLRHLRRTLRLSTPVPESIRARFSKYDRG